jgi:hypothetical protein
MDEPFFARDIEGARPLAWQALSNLFLDMELDDQDIATIATRLRSTGFTARELERIYEDEVAPACYRNLSALPGGEWSGFDATWLAEAIWRSQRRQSWLRHVPWLKRLFVERWTRASRADWQRVERWLSQAS